MTDAVRQLGVGPVPVHGPAPAVLCSRCKKPPEAGNIGAGGVSKQILFGIEFGNGRYGVLKSRLREERWTS